MPDTDTPTHDDPPSDHGAEREDASDSEVDDDTEVDVKERITACSALLVESIQSAANYKGKKTDKQSQKLQDNVKQRQEELAGLENMLDGLQHVRRLQQRIALPVSVAAATVSTLALTIPSATAASAAPVALKSAKVRYPQGLPAFRNGAGAIQEPREFVKRFQLIMQAHDLDLDQYWARFFLCCLPSDTSDWAAQGIPAMSTWEEAKEAFLHHFDSPANLREARRALVRMQMRPGESLSDYTQRFEKQMRLAQEVDTNLTVAACFLGSLPPEVHLLAENSMFNSGKQEPTISQLITFALSVSWKPKDTRPPPRSGGGHDAAGKHQQSATSKQKFCQLHGYGSHSTDQCRASQAHTSRSKHASRTSTVASASPAVSHPAAYASTSTVQCYSCNKTGHYASDCPEKQSTASGKRIAQLTTVIPARRADDTVPFRAPHEKTGGAKATRRPAGKAARVFTPVPTEKVDDPTQRAPASEVDSASTAASVKEIGHPPREQLESSVAPLYFIPVLLDGQKHMALLDCGANTSFIAQELAARLGKDIEPREGTIKLAQDSADTPRIGITSPIHLQVGSLDVDYRCEILQQPTGAGFVIGNDLIRRIGLDEFGLPFRYPDQISGASDDTIHRPIPLIASDFSEEEQSPDFTRFRESVWLAVQPELASNAAIPHDSFCPLAEAIVYLDTEAGKTTYRRQYPIPHSQHRVVDDKVHEWLKDGVIEPVKGPSVFNTPFFLVAKKDASGVKTDFRPCCDYRALNTLLPSDRSPIPLISDIFEALAGAKVFSTLDLRQAYHRLPITECDRYKTAFTWRDKQYQFRGAPFGLKTLPSQFQKLMSTVLDGLEFARVFIDDVVVFSKSWEDHAEHLKVVIQRLNQAKLILNVSKCHLARLEIKLLGFRINPYGKAIDPARLANLEDWPTPLTGKQLQSFLGFVNYLRDHIPKISELTAPLTAISAKDDIPAHWTLECVQAFRRLKNLIPLCPSLVHLDPSLELCVATDASDVGIGAVLYQCDPQTNAHHFISFQARTLSPNERNYATTKKELLS